MRLIYKLLVLSLLLATAACAYRTLEVLDKMAESENKVFLPVAALGTIGLQQAVFRDQMKRVARKDR